MFSQLEQGRTFGGMNKRADRNLVFSVMVNG